MWQRIQTVFLLVVILTMVSTIFLPLWVFQPGTENTHELYSLYYKIKEDGSVSIQYFPYALTAILAIASATIAAVSIGKYNNRLLQRKLGALNSLFMAATVGSAYYFVNQLIKSHAVSDQDFGIGFYLPIVAVIANFLANRFIMRDEKLVRDSDRLR
jgi:hypothetical protein